MVLLGGRECGVRRVRTGHGRRRQGVAPSSTTRTRRSGSQAPTLEHRFDHRLDRRQLSLEQPRTWISPTWPRPDEAFERVDGQRQRFGRVATKAMVRGLGTPGEAVHGIIRSESSALCDDALQWRALTPGETDYRFALRFCLLIARARKGARYVKRYLL